MNPSEGWGLPNTYVEDNGRGIPILPTADDGRSFMETLFTILHAGGKFCRKEYQVSGGLHGVGIAYINALASSLTVDVYRDGRHHRMQFARGEMVAPLELIGRTTKHGTVVRFTPDREIFPSDFYFDHLKVWQFLQQMAYLNPSISFQLANKTNGERLTMCYPEGGQKT